MMARAAQGRTASEAIALDPKQGSAQFDLGQLYLLQCRAVTTSTSKSAAIDPTAERKVVSTLASGTVRQFVGDKDIMMINSIVDILGLNRISRPMLQTHLAILANLC